MYKSSPQFIEKQLSMVPPAERAVYRLALDLADMLVGIIDAGAAIGLAGDLVQGRSHALALAMREAADRYLTHEK